MKRKNSETGSRKDGTNANNANVTSNPTVPIPRFTATPSNMPVTGRQRSEGFLSFFTRQDPRQIKKIAYSQQQLQLDSNDNSNNNNNNSTSRKNNKSQGRKRLDTFYVWILGICCAGLSGITIGYHYYSFMPTRTNLDAASTFLISKPRQSILLLPPNDKIPLELLTSVTRQSGSLLPLKLAYLSLDDPTVTTTGIRTTTTTTVTQQEPSSLAYPQEQLVNSTSSLATTPLYNQINYPPDTLDDGFYSDKNNADYGDVDVRFLTHDGQRRTIYRESWETQGQARNLDQERDDDVEEYWAFGAYIDIPSAMPPRLSE
jgi:hypothetical protein